GENWFWRWGVQILKIEIEPRHHRFFDNFCGRFIFSPHSHNRIIYRFQILKREIIENPRSKLSFSSMFSSS
ncbi:MAG: hypothetical protein KDD63_16730, partial [Bacteroidetes bacterium]|nr:hypothetical protein [Bacteroidota bacterium]